MLAGVRVGHVTLAEGERQTGVTAIVPPGDNLYLTPLPCGAEVLNGFAKPVGLTQVEELGVLHTPILLSNTLAVGTLFTALVRDAIRRNPVGVRFAELYSLSHRLKNKAFIKL